MTRHRADVAALNHLATILIDGRKLYARAARLADGDDDTVARIERTLGERASMLTEVQRRVHDLQGCAQNDGSFLGAARKAFLDVRALFDDDVEAALADVERGEDYLRDEIRKCMRHDELGAETRAFLGVLLDRIVNGEMRIKGKLEEVERHV